MVRYLETNNLIPESQFGFRKYRNTELCLMENINHIINGIQNNDNLRSIVTCIDIQKAFDSININRLLYIMIELKIPKQIVHWYFNFLKNRKYYVNINRKHSKFKNFKNGVPQGSISGPILFIIYMSSLDKYLFHNIKRINFNNNKNYNINNNTIMNQYNYININKILNQYNISIKLFADDMTIITSDNNINNGINVLQQLLNLIFEWSILAKLKFAKGKSELLLITTSNYEKIKHINNNNINIDLKLIHNKLNNVKIGMDIIIRKKYIKIFELFIDEALIFTQHLQKIKNK